MKSADSSSANIVLPQIITEDTLTTYEFVKPSILSGKSIADTQEVADKAFDETMNTYYSSANEECWVGVDFGEGFKADIQKIRYSPNSVWSNPSAILDGSVFEVSNDGIVWVTLFTLEAASINSGWSKWVA